MFKLIKFLLILFVIMLIAGTSMVFFALQSTPLVVETNGQQLNDADSVKQLIEQINSSLKNRTASQQIRLSENQLNSLVGFAQRARQDFNGKVHITAMGTGVFTTYKLPNNPFGQYLNVDFLILPGNSIAIEHMKIGGISIPGNWALWIMTKLINGYTHSDIASQFLAQVEHIAMDKGQMVITLHPLDAFLKELNLVKQELRSEGDQQQGVRTTAYLNVLVKLKAGKAAESQSLAEFIGPVFAEAQRRSNYATAVKENEAAILALAIYAGDHRFANFAGDLSSSLVRLAKPNAPPLLAQRVDLNLHFIFSAAINIISEQGLSIAIGEFKELMDRGQGGSGYSFIDLTADYAGVKLAQIATLPDKALQVQNRLANVQDESVFMPSIKGLPEGFSKAAFVQRFENVDSLEYSDLVQDIHQRVNALPLYQ